MNSLPADNTIASARASPEARQSGRLFLGLAAALLITAVLLRFLLVEGGGQFFFPDETRYFLSREAATLVASGNLRPGLLLPFSNSEHIGFKVLGLMPALLEERFGHDGRLPALFFSIFSVLNLLLIGLCARRLGASPMAQLWALFLGVCSNSLFYYTRHLFPYDASLCLGLLAFYIGSRSGGWRRSTAVGLLAGLAFITYLGYWTLAGTVMLLHLLRGGGWRLWLERALATGAGFGAVVAVVLLVNQLSTGHALADTLRFATTINQGDFHEGHSLPWRYLQAAEGLLLWVWLAAAAYAMVWLIRSQAARGGRNQARWLCLAALVLLYVIPLVTSNVLQKFVVYGRGARLEVPFFCLLTALVLDDLDWSKRVVRLAVAGLAVLVAISAVLRFAVPLTQQFPAAFRTRGDALLRQRPPPDPGSYYRYVNVNHYVMAAEVLKQAPAETLLVAAHPYQFEPYLFEGFSPAERARRRSVDHRMRLVRMLVPANERVTGEPYGLITLRLRFPERHAGFTEPLLSVGPHGEGDLFFVRYPAADRGEFGLESMGEQIIKSETVDIAPGRTHVLELFSGTLAPPPADEKAAGTMAGMRHAYYRNRVYLRFDDRVLLNTPVPGHTAGTEEIYVGFNHVEADSAGSQFSGEILSAQRGGLPPAPQGLQENYGAMELTLIPPASRSGIPEPLVVAGETGRGVFAFIKHLPDGTYQFGIEIWSVGAWVSKPLKLKPGVAAKVVFSFGALLPPAGHPAWGRTPVEIQRKLKRRLRITVDGSEVFSAERETPEFAQLPLYIGVNPIGGSYVGARFSGEILSALRLPVEAETTVPTP